MSKAWEEIVSGLKKNEFYIKEFLTRSEGPELFVDLLNQKLLEGLMDYPSNHMAIFDEIRLTQGRTINFPSIRGINPTRIAELQEYPFHDWTLTSVSVDVEKFGIRLGISEEMLEDNQVGLIARNTRMLGRAHAQLNADEHIKCISRFSTQAGANTGMIGNDLNQALRYPSLGYANVVAGTDVSWEVRLARGINQLWSQVITGVGFNGSNVRFPVQPNFLVANPVHDIPLRKVLGTTITVLATGAGAGGNAIADRTLLAGNNVFNGLIPILILHPEMPTGQALLGKAKDGLVSVRRDDLQIDQEKVFAFDATQLKSRERFLPAVVEDRFIADIQFTA